MATNNENDSKESNPPSLHGIQELTTDRFEFDQSAVSKKNFR